MTFVDTWKDFDPIDPEIVITQLEDDSYIEKKKATQKLIPIPQEIIDECYKLLLSMQMGEILNSFEAIPHSWYEWDAPENAEDENLPDKKRILIFERQVEGYNQLEMDVKEGKLILPEDITEAFVENIRERYFEVCPDPVPQSYDLRDLLRAWKDTGSVDSIFKSTFPERDKFDTRKIAKEFIDNDYSESKQEELVDSYWSDPICQRCFNDIREKFVEDIDRYKRQFKDKNKKTEQIRRIRHEIPKQTLEKWHAGNHGYNLRELVEVVGNNKKLFPNGKPMVKSVDYKKKLYRSNWLGQCNMSDGNEIFILESLNSPSVPLAVMEFLMYHEMIHAAGYGRHDGTFKELEKKFIPSNEAVENAHQYSEWKDTLKNTQFSWQALCWQFLYSFFFRFQNDGSTQGEY